MKTPTPQENDAGASHFEVEQVRGKLRTLSLRGGRATITAQLCRFVINLVTLGILARALTKEDFGLVAMVTAITNLAVRFSDLGLAESTIQQDKIDQRQISMLFWLNVLLGLVAMLLVMLSAPLIALLYDEPRLTKIAVGLSLAFGLTGLSVQHTALLRRQMRFGTLAIIEVAVALLGTLTAIATVSTGYWALVLMAVSMPLYRGILVWICCSWRPSAMKRGSGAAAMVKFGSQLTAARLLLYLQRNFDRTLIGFFWGANLLAGYEKAAQLMVMPVQQINTPISNVAVATLSRLRDQHERFIHTYQKALQLLATVGMPAVAWMFVAADDIVLIVLGDQWLDVGPILRALGPAAFLGTFNMATGWVYIPFGLGARQLRWSMISTVIVCVTFAATVKLGPFAVALAFSIVTCMLRIPALSYCYRDTPLRLKHLLAALWRPASCSIVAGAFCWPIQMQFLAGFAPIGRLLIGAVTYGFGYLVAWFMMPNGRQTLAAMLLDIRSSFRERQSSESAVG